MSKDFCKLIHKSENVCVWAKTYLIRVKGAGSWGTWDHVVIPRKDALRCYQVGSGVWEVQRDGFGCSTPLLLWGHQQLMLTTCFLAPLSCLLFGWQCYWYFFFFLKCVELTQPYPEPLANSFFSAVMLFFPYPSLPSHPVNSYSAFKIQFNTSRKLSLTWTFPCLSCKLGLCWYSNCVIN